jgi:hypothetical protein
MEFTKRENLMNLAELEKMRDAFKSRCADFVDFQQTDGVYFDQERGNDKNPYKNALIEKAKTILAGPGGDQPENVGLQFLELVEGIKKGGFVGWQAFDAIKKGGDNAKHEVSLALGEMLLLKERPAVAAAAAAELIHPILSKGRGGKNSFGYVRSLVSSVLALAKPSEAIAVKTDYIGKAFTRLTGKKLFKNRVMSADEYQALLDLAKEIQVQLDGWGWKTRDLWDVQGFLWVVADYPPGPTQRGPVDKPPVDGPTVDPRRHPLNLILYGPPGTGKTWATARKAVEICTGTAVRL